MIIVDDVEYRFVEHLANYVDLNNNTLPKDIRTLRVLLAFYW